MIYLTKSFTCVIVSGWCDQVGFQTVFEDVKAWRIPSLLWKFIPITDSRRQERCIVKTRIRIGLGAKLIYMGFLLVCCTPQEEKLGYYF